ncbi:hypothetical protein SUGI_0075140 [Cryptomeria japonica]|nr:hypothetical protein SUGI_0075140 [Cryptomeria japonica]
MFATGLAGSPSSSSEASSSASENSAEPPPRGCVSSAEQYFRDQIKDTGADASRLSLNVWQSSCLSPFNLNTFLSISEHRQKI